VRPGGRIGLASWTPEGFLGELFRLNGSFVPPPAALASPMLWGTETRLVELFGPHASEVRSERRFFNFRYLSAEHFIEVFRGYYGPTHKVFAALPPARQGELHIAMIELLSRHNRARGMGKLVVPAEYLESIIVKR
jgi:hypothetical protein